MKMYCIFSAEAIKDMGGNRGKMAAQAGHAFLHAFWSAEKCDRLMAESYRSGGMAKKITLVVPTTAELLTMYLDFQFRGLGVTLVTDAARTVFEKPTITCVGVGPVPDDYDCPILKSLKVLI